MRVRAVRVMTTLPLLLGAAFAWWFGYGLLAIVCAVAGLLLAALQWMTVRALAHNAPPDAAAGPLADRERGSV
jgi:hypothetical protein